jgi:hypothetical protein
MIRNVKQFQTKINKVNKKVYILLLFAKKNKKKKKKFLV